MDLIYILIIVVFIAVVYCDYMDRKITGQDGKEKFENYEIEHVGGFNKGPYTQNKNLIEYKIGADKSSVNFNYRNKNLNFQNFTTDGVTPPYLRCPMCTLQFDCTSYPYQISDKEGNVCTTCMDRIFMDEYNFPVLARTNGRPRVCRSLFRKNNYKPKAQR